MVAESLAMLAVCLVMMVTGAMAQIGMWYANVLILMAYNKQYTRFSTWPLDDHNIFHLLDQLYVTANTPGQLSLSSFRGRCIRNKSNKQWCLFAKLYSQRRITYMQIKHLLKDTGVRGPPKVNTTYHSASELRRTRSRRFCFSFTAPDIRLHKFPPSA